MLQTRTALIFLVHELATNKGVCYRICASIAPQVTLPFSTDLEGTGLNCGLASPYFKVQSRRVIVIATVKAWTLSRTRRRHKKIKFVVYSPVLCWVIMKGLFHRRRAWIREGKQKETKSRNLFRKTKLGRKKINSIWNAWHLVNRVKIKLFSTKKLYLGEHTFLRENLSTNPK